MDKDISVDMIHQLDISDLRRDLHLDYVFQTTGNSFQWYDKKIALIIHFCDVDLINSCLEYIQQVPKYIDVFITTASEKIACLIESKFRLQSGNNTYLITNDNCSNELESLLVVCKEVVKAYTYLGFVYEKGKNRDVAFQTIDYSLHNLMWENSLKNSIYIEHIIEAFEREPRLGILAPPLPYLSTYLKTSFKGWESYYEETLQLAQKLKLRCQINHDRPPYILDSSLWCRVSALEPLFVCEDSEIDIKQVVKDKSNVIKKIFPYVAQSQGYYSGLMMTPEYASLYISNYQYMVNVILEKVYER